MVRVKDRLRRVEKYIRGSEEVVWDIRPSNDLAVKEERSRARNKERAEKEGLCMCAIV